MTEREVESRCGGCNKVPVEGDGHAEDYCPFIELGDPSTFVNAHQLYELLGREREVESRSLEWTTLAFNKDNEVDKWYCGRWTIGYWDIGEEDDPVGSKMSYVVFVEGWDEETAAISYHETLDEAKYLAQRLADVLDGVPDQARAEQPSSDLCPDCGQSLRGAGE